MKVYDYVFSKNVVDDLEMGYPEGFHRACKLFRLSNRDVVWIFQSNQPEWSRFRKIAKFLSQNEPMLRDLYHRGPNRDQYKHRYGSYDGFCMTMIAKAYLGKDSIFTVEGVDKENVPDYNIIGHDDKGKRSQEPKQLLLFPNLMATKEQKDGNRIRTDFRDVPIE